jgi:hypothetical protein
MTRPRAPAAGANPYKTLFLKDLAEKASSQSGQGQPKAANKTIVEASSVPSEPGARVGDGNVVVRAETIRTLRGVHGTGLKDFEPIGDLGQSA